MRLTLRAFAAIVLLGSAAAAQQYVISTYAGGAAPAPAADGSIGAPVSVAADAVGNAYFASPALNAVFKLSQNAVLTRVAGNSKFGYSGDGGPAADAQLRLGFGNASSVSSGVTVDGAGNLFIVDTGNHCIRRVSPEGIITTVAGNGTQGFSGDGGPATSAQLNWPWGAAVDGAGNLFIVDAFNYRVRKVSASGIITTVAGGGTMSGALADGGPATSAQMTAWAVAASKAGDIFIADNAAGRIRKVSPDGIITTVANMYGWALAVDGAGNVFIADGIAAIRKISSSGAITTVAGGGAASLGDGGPATSARLSNPSGVAVDGRGNLFIADQTNIRVRKVSSSGIITTVAGNGNVTSFFSGDGGPAAGAQLKHPASVALDGAGNLFFSDVGNGRVRKISPSGIVTTVAGGGDAVPGDGGPATGAQLDPWGVAVDGAGNLFITDGNARIRKVNPDGTISTVAGNGKRGFSGDGGQATNAALDLNSGCNGPCGGIALDSAGNLFIADSGNNRVRRVSSGGIITSVAGNGTCCGSPGDGAPATSAQLSFPTGVAVDSLGNLFIANAGSVRKVSKDGIITTVAGREGGCGYRILECGDGGPATGAYLSWPSGVAVDGSGNLFIADPGWLFFTGGPDEPCCSNRIRKISSSGIITTVAGTGAPGFSGDGGPATAAALNAPAGIAVDGAGNVYLPEAYNNVIRILRPTNYPALIGSVVDAASQRTGPVSPGKIVVIYGDGLGPSQLVQNRPSGETLGTEFSGTTVSFNGIAAPILYTSARQIAAIVPYTVTGTTAQVTVAYQGQFTAAFTVPIAASAPGLFTLNQSGAGQASAVNAVDGTLNTAANPVKIGGYISLYATGEGQTTPAGVDGKLGSTPTRPVLPVSVLVGGIPATFQYAGGAPGQVAGLMQVNVQIPNGVQPGRYVPIDLQVGDASTTPGAVWVAVSGN